MREHRSLTPVEERADQSIIVQSTSTPVLRGQIPGGFDYVCGCCGQSVLVENTIDGEIYGIVFECANCQGLSAAPDRPRGRPLTKRRTVLPPGLYETAQPDSIQQGQILVGAATERAYLAEIGPQSLNMTDINDAASIEVIIDGIREALGDVFDELDRKDTHRRKLKDMAPLARHPLMVRIERLRFSAASIRAGVTMLDGEALVEMAVVLALYRQFRGNPAWKTVRKNAQDGPNAVHDIFTLGFAALMAETGTGVNVHEVLGERAADVLLAVSSDGFVSVEVKTPRELQTDNPRLTAETAYRLVAKRFRKADARVGGQLSGEHPGLLVLAAWHLSATNIQMIDGAAQKWFEVHKKTKRHIFGLALLSIQWTERSALPHDPLIETLRIIRPATPVLESQLATHYSHNPYYTGTINLRYA